MTDTSIVDPTETPSLGTKIASTVSGALGGTPEPGLTLTGPNEVEANADLKMVRQQAGTPEGTPLPPIYRAMGQARAAGYDWSEVNNVVGDVRDAMSKSGYKDSEISNYLYGVPLDTSPSRLVPQVSTDGSKLPVMDQIAQSLRSFSSNVEGPISPFARANLSEPGLRGSDLWKSMGWDTVAAARTFGADMVNAMGAAAEMMDMKPRTEWERDKLLHEAAPALMFLLPVKGAGMEAHAAEGEVAAATAGPARPGTTPFPKPEEFFDAATAMSAKGGVLDEEGMRDALGKLGDHWQATGEHPMEAAMKANADPNFQWQKPPANGGVYTQEPISGRITSRQGLPPPTEETMAATNEGDPTIEGAAERMAAEDKVVPPGRVDVNPEEPANFKWKDFMADERGSVNMPQMDITPERLYQRDPEIAEGLVQNLKSIITPYNLAPNAAEMLAGNRARSVAMTERSVGNLVRFGRAVGDLSTTERWAYIDGLESGEWRPENRAAELDGTPLASLHDQLRKELDFRYDEMEKRGIGPGYVEDYLPHLYADPAKFRNYFTGNGTLAGAKTFTRQRVLGSYAAAREAGLTPATDNPINMTIQALRQMDQYIGAHDSVTELANAGVVKGYGPDEAAPGDWVRINGKLGLRGTGTLYAPRDVANMVNSLVDTGFAGSSLYRLVRDASMTTFRTKLALSGFHATFVALDSVNSAVALAAQQISRGAGSEVAEGIKTLLTAPGAPVRNYLNGKKLGSILSGTEDLVSGTDAKIADLFVAGGGRAHMEPLYRGNAFGSFLNGLKGTFMPSTGRATFGQEVAQTIRDAQPVKAWGQTIVPGIVRAAFQLIQRTLDTASAPIMEHLVPTLKRGVFYQGMSDYLRAFPEAGTVEARHYAHTLLKSIDNRLGEMVQDNRFWNKYQRDAMQIVYPALGWHAGTIAELAGGAGDMVGGRSQVVGKYNQITQRSAYVVALPLVTALASAVYGYMKGTWNDKWDAKDYMAPPTGGVDAHGYPERAMMPGYHKDAWEMWNTPEKYAAGGLNPLATTLWSAINNRQYNGAAITDPSASPMQNLDDYANWTLHEMAPITMQPMTKTQQQGTEIGSAERFFGIRPAPMVIGESERVHQFEEKDTRAAVKKKQKMDNQ